MPTLRNLRLQRIALVPMGANPEANITLYKAYGDDEGGEPPFTTLEALSQNQFWAQWSLLWDAFHKSIYSLLEACETDPAGSAPLLMQSINEFQGQARMILTSLGLLEKAKPLLDALTPTEYAIQRSADPSEQGQGTAYGGKRHCALVKSAVHHMESWVEKNCPQPKEGTNSMHVEALQKQIADLKATNATLATKNADLEKRVTALAMTPEQQETEYFKSLPAAVQATILKEREEKEQLQKDFLALKSAQQQQIYVTKTALYRHVGMRPDDWQLLQAIDTLPETFATRLNDIFKAVSTQLEKSPIFAELGTGGDHTLNADSAEAQLQVLVNAEVAKNGKPYAEALAVVVKANKGLYDRYTMERQKQSRVVA